MKIWHCMNINLINGPFETHQNYITWPVIFAGVYIPGNFLLIIVIFSTGANINEIIYWLTKCFHIPFHLTLSCWLSAKTKTFINEGKHCSVRISKSALQCLLERVYFESFSTNVDINQLWQSFNQIEELWYFGDFSLFFSPLFHKRP